VIFLSTRSKIRNGIVRRIQIFEMADSDSKHERLCLLRVTQRFSNTITVCSHAPVEEKDDISKDPFFDKFGEVRH
jgi:hypothetical protein